MHRSTLRDCLAAVLAVAALPCGDARGVTFTTSYTDGSSWNTLYGQGFSPSVLPTPDPGLAPDAIVPLDRFQFFKSGSVDAAANFRLAILSNFFVNLQTLTTSSLELAGLSTNVITDTAAIATGEAITFSFDSVPLVYGNDYAAIFVTEGAEGALTPVLVSAMLADYVEDPPGSGTYRPESDYGDPDVDYFKSASNYINESESGSYLAAFNAPYADASFVASFDLPAASIPGDFDGSGTVDANDLAQWKSQFGQAPGNPPADGDADGDVDGADFLIWQRHVGETAALGPAIAAAPEPAACWLTAIAFAASIAARRRCR